MIAVVVVGLVLFGWALFDSQSALERYVARKHFCD